MVVAKEEFYQTKEQWQLDSTKLNALRRSIWTAAWKKKSYRKRMVIGFLTQWQVKPGSFQTLSNRCGRGAEFAGPLIINNYAVILYTNLGATGHMPLLLSALWLTTAGLIYNPLGAWLHDKVNSRRRMYIFGLFGCLLTTSLLAAMTAEFSGTANRAGNGMGIFFIFLYLAFQGTCCDTTMYLYVSEIFPTELRPMGMGFSLFGQFAASLVLLQTAPIGFAEVGWKYYLVVIVWCIFYIPMVYFFWPETARLSLEEIGKQFGDDVAVHINDATDEEKRILEQQLKDADVVHQKGDGLHPSYRPTGSIVAGHDVLGAPNS
ncbi:hypothetical protein SLS60_000446 [Paraconiothyrium brasiliense]|uniref:Major facilitator superfamily (MFS) profile domain-containing protein n=1 Tax=Paraconiothyrium brasiliense TaxID=300254 RepID=A0ABR3S7Q5_9PLEO